MVTVFKKSSSSEEDVPLTWRNYRDHTNILDISPIIVCPKNHYLSIHKHAVLPDGTVQPSVECPIKDCGFHDNIRLEEWDGFLLPGGDTNKMIIEAGNARQWK